MSLRAIPRALAPVLSVAVSVLGGTLRKWVCVKITYFKRPFSEEGARAGSDKRLPATIYSRSTLIGDCNGTIKGPGEAVLKKRKIGINSSLEFKFFSIEISFGVLKIMYPAGIFICFLEKREEEGKEGDVFLLGHLNPALRSISHL